MPKIEVTLTDDDLTWVEAERGLVPRSAFIRSLVATARNDRQPDKPEPWPAETQAAHSSPGGASGGKAHRHHYQRFGDPVRHEKGVAIYQKICGCGASKEEA